MRRRTLGALIAVSATALATLTSPSPARAEMVYRIATMGEPKTPRPARRLRHLGELRRRRHVHGPADRRRRRHADPGCRRELDDQRRRADLHLQDPRPHLVGRHAGHRRGLRLLAASASSTRRPRPSTPRCSIRSRTPRRSTRARSPTRPQLGVTAIDPKTLEVTLERPTGYFLELLTHYTVVPGAQARHREVRRRTGSSPATSSATARSRSSSGRRTRRSWRSRTPSSTTPPTSRSTRSSTTRTRTATR